MVVGCGSNTASNTPTTTPVSTQAPANATDLDVLNFALNLEYLEASFYLLASTGTGIPSANQGTSPGKVTGGAKVIFTPAQAVLQEYAAEIAQEELNHVIFLRAAITEFGGTPVDMPEHRLLDVVPGTGWSCRASAAPSIHLPIPCRSWWVHSYLRMWA